ncbi:MAG: SDR family oxidoreductase [Chitinophagales bacterium]|nr:SDR family oxidoreductase [Chitinophagales bacterium]
MKKALVTGGCGFIGSHMVDRLLQEGYQVTVIDNLSTGRRENLQHQKENKALQIIEADINDVQNNLPYFENVDTVFHIAALADIVPSIENPLSYYRSNVDGTFAVLECARAQGVKRVIYAASSSCYGLPDTFPTPETTKIDTQYPYALTKFLGEQLCLHWSKVYKLNVTSMRFFNVYGTRSRTSGTYGAVFGVFLAQKLNNKPFTVVGDGTQTRDFTYVTDIVDACYTASLRNDISGEIFNVGSGNTYSVNRLTELLQGEKVYIPKRPGEPDCTFADITKIQSQLNWQPKVSLEDGVQKILDNIAYWKNAPVWEPTSIAKATEGWFKYLGK